MSKVCSGCKKELPFESFNKNKAAKDGYQWHCKDCRREFMVRDRLRHKEKRYITQAKWRKRNPNKVKSIKLRGKYGIDYEHYKEMYDSQKGLCKICEDFYEILCVDHCHKTGKVRGLLCAMCNLGVGNFLEDEGRMMKAIEYVRECS